MCLLGSLNTPLWLLKKNVAFCFLFSNIFLSLLCLWVLGGFLFYLSPNNIFLAQPSFSWLYCLLSASSVSWTPFLPTPQSYTFSFTTTLSNSLLSRPTPDKFKSQQSLKSIGPFKGLMHTTFILHASPLTLATNHAVLKLLLGSFHAFGRVLGSGVIFLLILRSASTTELT
jgi:hypothetical protein